MLIQRIQNQGCIKKRKFVTNKLLVSGNGSINHASYQKNQQTPSGSEDEEPS